LKLISLESGTGQRRCCYPADLEKSRPLLIGLGNWSRSDLQDQKSRELNLEVVMASRNECERSRARLQRETPISDDASLLVLQEQAAEYVRESKRRDASEPDELISAVVDAVARDYFQHVLRIKLRRGGS
jgi:hypothetical protein